MGFRYARIKVLSGNVNIKTITSIPISSLHEQKLQFQSSNKNVNKLIENTSWSQKANFIEVPTDCPQRDERLGWTGDAQLFSSTACYFYNCEKFFIKYLKDLVSEQDVTVLLDMYLLILHAMAKQMIFVLYRKKKKLMDFGHIKVPQDGVMQLLSFRGLFISITETLMFSKIVINP